MRLHPELPRSSWATTIPLGLHGDGASFAKHDSIYVFSWSSLVGSGTTVQKRFWGTIIKKTDMVPGTIDAIMQVLSWSFNALLRGARPELDWAGVPTADGGGVLADGWKGALCQVRGDWAFFCELFNFPKWNGAERMCFVCRASSTNAALAWTKFGPDAGWRRTRWSHETYLRCLRNGGFAIPALLCLAIGFRLDCVMIDVLHTVDQGVASHIIANIMWVFAVVRGVIGGANQAERVANLHNHMQKLYKTMKERTKVQGKLSVERIRTSGNWPKLKAKAAATRHLAKYALSLVQEFGGKSVEDRRMLGVCQQLVRFYAILDTESHFLSAPARIELPKVGQQLVGLYTALAADAKERGQKLWKLMPKLHLFLHLCEWQSLAHGNPRYCWTYADEDLAGMMAEVAGSCHPATLAPSGLFKWLHTAFQGHEE